MNKFGKQINIFTTNLIFFNAHIQPLHLRLKPNHVPHQIFMPSFQLFHIITMVSPVTDPDTTSKTVHDTFCALNVGTDTIEAPGKRRFYPLEKLGGQISDLCPQ